MACRALKRQCGQALSAAAFAARLVLRRRPAGACDAARGARMSVASRLRCLRLCCIAPPALSSGIACCAAPACCSAAATVRVAGGLFQMMGSSRAPPQLTLGTRPCAPCAVQSAPRASRAPLGPASPRAGASSGGRLRSWTKCSAPSAAGLATWAAPSPKASSGLRRAPAARHSNAARCRTRVGRSRLCNMRARRCPHHARRTAPRALTRRSRTLGGRGGRAAPD